jgi:hypothetical protein
MLLQHKQTPDQPQRCSRITLLAATHLLQHSYRRTHYAHCIVLQGEHIANPARCAFPLFAGRTRSGTNRTTLLLCAAYPSFGWDSSTVTRMKQAPDADLHSAASQQ